MPLAEDLSDEELAIMLDRKRGLSSLSDEDLQRAILSKRAPGTAGQAALGLAEGGFGTFGNIQQGVTGLLGFETPEALLPGQKALLEAERELPETALPFLTEDDDLFPSMARLPTSQDIADIARALGFSTGKSEEAGGRFARRIGRGVGTALGTGGGVGTTLAFGAGAVAGQAVEEATGSEFAGDMTELATGLGLDLGAKSFAKRIVPKKSQEALASVAKKYGLSEAQLSPLLQDKKIERWAKFAHKGDDTQRFAAAIESQLGSGYDVLREEAKSLKPLTKEAAEGMTGSFQKLINEMNDVIKPTPETERAVRYLSDVLSIIKKGPIKPSQLIGQWKELNSFVDWSKVNNGQRILGTLKGPMLEALRTSGAEVASDFEALNTLYSASKRLTKGLRPSDVDKFLSYGQVGALTLGMATLDPTIIYKVLKGSAIKAVSRRAIKNYMLSPRYQNLSGKILKAVKDGNLPRAAAITKKLTTRIQNDFSEDKPRRTKSA